MIGRELVEAFAFTAPVVCALVCMVMVLLDARTRGRSREDRQLRLFLALAYFVTSLGWMGLVFYTIYPRVFIYYHSVFLLTLMLDQVLFYRFVAILTGTGEYRRFGRLHLAIPLGIVAVSVIFDFAVPVSLQAAVVYGDDASGTWFRVMYAVTTLVFVVYNTVYPALSLRNIRRYKRCVVNYSSDARRSSLGWLALMQALILVCVPVPLAGLLFRVPVFATNYFVWLGALPTFVFYLILCYNLLDDNYVIIRQDAGEEEYPPDKSIPPGRARFTRYMREKKPYLNPKLRITDLAAGMHTNRSYLSAFINKEFGMNFCRLINRYRLAHLERLRLSPDNAGKSKMELVIMAGFSNYRSYLRVKEEERLVN